MKNYVRNLTYTDFCSGKNSLVYNLYGRNLTYTDFCSGKNSLVHNLYGRNFAQGFLGIKISSWSNTQRGSPFYAFT